jgi:hypothetical protein
MYIYLPRGLPPRHAQFLLLLAVRTSLTRADYQRLIGVSHATAKRDLASLAADGLLLPLGTARARRYTLGPAVAVRPNLTDTPPDDPAIAPNGDRSPGAVSDRVAFVIDPLQPGRRLRDHT